MSETIVSRASFWFFQFYGIRVWYLCSMCFPDPVPSIIPPGYGTCRMRLRLASAQGDELEAGASKASSSGVPGVWCQSLRGGRVLLVSFLIAKKTFFGPLGVFLQLKAWDL